jgi:hypothetical protein
VTAPGAVLELAARRKALRQALAPGWALLACALVAVHAPAGARAPVVIVFLCFVPGTALVGLLNPDSFAVELSLSVALSVGLSGLTAGVLVYAHLWSPTAVVVIVAAISLAGALRDVGGGDGVHRISPRLVQIFLAPLSGARRVAAAGFPAAVILTAELVGRAGRLLSVALTAVPRLGRRAEVRRHGGAALVAFGELARPTGRRLQRIASVRWPRPTAHRSRRERVEAAPVDESPLQRFLLDELRRRADPSDSRRGPPRSLAHAEPQELADLLSWSSLQRFVTRRAIREVNPELWFVDDLERGLRRQAPGARGGVPRRAEPATPRGVWITGVSARTSIPVAWRLLEDDGKPKEWRTRLALELIDTLPELGLGETVVAAGPAYGSLSGFRRGLEERGLPYLLRVDPVTAARELAPRQTSRSAGQAREVLQERIADRVTASAATRANGAREEAGLVLVQGAEHLLVCEVPATGRPSVFWLSNLAGETPPERLASLIRLTHRSRVGRATPELLLGTLDTQAEGGAALDRELALVALAGGLRTLDPSSAPARGGVET